MQLPNEHDVWQVRAHVIACPVDLPARAMVQNVTQFNGFHGCSFCQQAGKTVVTGGGGHVHVYPFDEANPDGPSREHETLIKHAALALEESKPVRLICIQQNYIA